MKIENLINLKTWQFNSDQYGSEFKILNNDIIAAKLKKVKTKKHDKAYNNVKIFLNHFFEKKYFHIEKCKEFTVTYKSSGLSKIEFILEENYNIYNFYYNLPPSEKWISRKIKIKELFRGTHSHLYPDLTKLTGLIFNYIFQDTGENTGSLYIKEFIIEGYQVISLDNGKYSGYTNFLLRKNIFNHIKAVSLNKKQQNKKIDAQGNALYCIYPFYQYRINKDYLTVCCDIYNNENINFMNNKNLLDVWWGKNFDEIRQGIKNLSYSKCNLKRCIQYNTTRESFKNINTIKKEYPEIADYLEGKSEYFRGLPNYIVAGFDSTCNLTCRSCNVTKTQNLPKEIGWHYIQQIKDIGKNVERILIAGYGDPFASPSYREWLYNFSEKNFPKLKRIEIMTNAILWTEENWKKVSADVKKKEIIGIISIDGATKKTYEYNRGNAKFEKLKENLEFISGLRKSYQIKSLALCFVIQKNNYKEILLMIEFAKKYSFDSILFNKITNWGAYTKEEFKKINIFDKKHPDYNNIKKIYTDLKRNKSGTFKIYFGFKL